MAAQEFRAGCNSVFLLCLSIDTLDQISEYKHSNKGSSYGCISYMNKTFTMALCFMTLFELRLI
jgi:hypothetical protein